MSRERKRVTKEARGPFIYARAPGVQSGGSPATGWTGGKFPAEPDWQVQPGNRLLRSFGGHLGPMMMASSRDDPFLYGLNVLSLDDMLGQLGNKVETTSCFCYWL